MHGPSTMLRSSGGAGRPGGRVRAAGRDDARRLPQMRHPRARAPPPALAPSARPPPAAASLPAAADAADDDADAELELTEEELAMAMADGLPPAAVAGEAEADDDDAAADESDDSLELLDFDDTDLEEASGPVEAAALSPADDEARELALAIAGVAADTKAGDVAVLHVAPLVYWTSYMVLVTIFSRPQLQAVLAKAEDVAAERFGRNLGGARNPGRSAWEALDFGDVVLHVFTPDQREFYDLEGFYGAAEEVALPAARPGEAGGEWRRAV